MDTPLYTVPPAGTSPSSQHRTAILLVLIGLIAILIGGYILYRMHYDAPDVGTLMIAPDGLPLVAAQSLNVKEGTLSPRAAGAQGTAVLIDTAASAAYTYYLIADATHTTVNLYREDRTQRDRGLEQLTTSATIKYDLSLDEVSGTLAYVSMIDGVPTVTVWDPSLERELSLGAGEHPTVLPNGFYVLFERDDKIYTIEIGINTPHELLTLGDNAPFVVSTDQMTLAVYDPVNASIEEYSIARTTALDHLTSTPVQLPPHELAYIHDAIVQITTTPEGELLLVSGKKTMTLPARLKPAIVGNFKLTANHD